MSGGEKLMSIGLFSRASLLSIKALRAYHEADILVPAEVDPRTGYRAYHVAQLTDAAVVRRLRSLDLPLAQVRAVLQASDPDVTRKVLAEHARVMEGRLDEVTRVVAELQDSVELPTTHTPVHVRTEPLTFALAVTGRAVESDYPAFLGGAFAELGAEVERLGVVPNGPSSALFPPEITGDPDDVVAFLPTPASVPDAATAGRVLPLTLANCEVAVAVHIGPYETIGDTYRQVGAWVALNAIPADQPVREQYLVSYDDTADTSRFVTEICWPVA